MPPQPLERRSRAATQWRLAGWLLSLAVTGVTADPGVEPDNTSATTLRSGYYYQSADTQALQDDDFQNPGMLWVDRGAELFTTAAGKSDKACRDCHDDLNAVATHFPKLNSATGQLKSLTHQIQDCRTEQQQAAPIEYESPEALALTAYVGYQSRGLTVAPREDPALASWLDWGVEYYSARKGQLNLSCSHCHDQSVGQQLRGDTISEGHANAYPIYRLEWQNLGSLHRRLRACNIGVRAQPFELGSQEYTALELYLQQRGTGLTIETPGVRR